MKTITIIKVLIFCGLLTIKGSDADTQTLTVYSIPSNASVLIDDVKVGTTPFRVKGLSGQNAVIQIHINSLESVLIDHVFQVSESVYVDLTQGMVIDAMSFWQQRTVTIEPEIIVDSTVYSEETDYTTFEAEDPPDFDEQTEYYTDQEVNQNAIVLTQPPIGSIPVEIIQLNMQGSAVFRIFINAEGLVDNAEPVEGTGNEVLDRYIIQMIKGSFWEPAIKNGVPVRFTRTLDLEYNTSAIRFRFIDIERL